MNKLDLIDIRKYDPKTDKNFILATWLRALYYGNDWFHQIPKDIFMENYKKVIGFILENANTQVFIACLKEDPNVILGYSVLKPIENNQIALHFTFVKSAWRNIGIAKSLIPNATKAVTHLTKTGQGILKNHTQIHFNPFIV